MGPAPLHLDLRRILADRHAPEATALFQRLLAFVERRVAHLAHTRCRGLLTDADREEVLGEVLFQLIEGALARFRGDTLPELLAFVRTMTDRLTVRRAQRRLRERETAHDLEVAPSAHWTPTAAKAPDDVELDVASPLGREDQRYLTELIQAGSKAELARTRSVSRAAVTQRVNRILERVDALGPVERAAHDVWLEQVASEAIEAGWA